MQIRKICLGLSVSFLLVNSVPIYANTVYNQPVNNPTITINTDDNNFVIEVSEDTVESFNSISNEEDIVNAGYTKIDSADLLAISTGDLMYCNDKFYLCLKDGENISWWTTNDSNEFILDNEIEFNSEECVVYHKTMDETAFPIPNSLIGYDTDALSTVSLPTNYRWVDGSITLEGVGNHTYRAYYIPEDILNSKTMQIDLTVNIKPHLNTVSIGEKYTVKYVPHLTAEMVGIPEGWVINNGNKELEIGENKVTATYKFKDGTTDSKNITITVEKGELRINGIMITVVEGTTLTDDLLPNVGNGLLSWTEAGKIAIENVNSTCIFTPNDTERYESVEDINVIINVVPKTIVKNTEDNSEDISDSDNNDNPSGENNNTDNADNPSTDNDTQNTDNSTNNTNKNDTTNNNTNNINDNSDKSNANNVSNDVTANNTLANNKANNQLANNTTKTIDVTSSKSNNTSNNTNNSVSDTTDKVVDTDKESANNNVDLKNIDLTSNKSDDKKEDKVQLQNIDLTSPSTEKHEEIVGGVQMNDIVLTKKEDNSKKDKPEIEMTEIDLTKKDDKTTEDDNKKTTTEEATEESTEEKNKEATKTDADDESTSTDATPSDSKESNINEGLSNKTKMVVTGIAVVIATGGLFVIKGLKKRKMK